MQLDQAIRPEDVRREAGRGRSSEASPERSPRRRPERCPEQRPERCPERRDGGAARALLLVLLAALSLGAGLSVLSSREAPGREAPSDASAERPEGGADEEEHDYLRFVPGDDPGEGELQTAIVTMVGEGGVTVDLISVVHVADGAYYRKLEKRFRAYDSLLYEMVKDEDVKPVPGEGGGLLTFFQRTLKDLLDLEFQLDAVDYTRKNFVHADLDPDTFARLQRERGESLLSLMFKVLKADLLARQSGEKSPQVGLVQLALALSSDDSARALKYLLAQQMQHMEAIIAGIEESPSGEGSVIVAERNRKAIEVLRARLKAGDRKLGIFYGGAHMPDMEKRLARELGLRRSGEEWLAAWSIRRKKETGPAAGLRRFFQPGSAEAPGGAEPQGPSGGAEERKF